MSGWIDTSGELPSLKASAAITGIAATIIYGAQQAFLRAFNGVTTGFLTFLDGIANYQGAAIPAYVDGSVGIMDVAAAGHAEWLATLGVWGYLVVVVEAITAFLIMMHTARFLINYFLGSI